MLVSKVKIDGVGEAVAVDWLEDWLVEACGGFRASGVEVDVFLQVPNLIGRQVEHDFPAFTQAQLLHKPDLLHLQHAIEVLRANQNNQV